MQQFLECTSLIVFLYLLIPLIAYVIMINDVRSARVSRKNVSNKMCFGEVFLSEVTKVGRP